MVKHRLSKFNIEQTQQQSDSASETVPELESGNER